MTKMGLEGLNARKSGIWGQNDVVLVHQRLFFFLIQGTTQNVVLVSITEKRSLGLLCAAQWRRRLRRRRRKGKKKPENAQGEAPPREWWRLGFNCA